MSNFPDLARVSDSMVIDHAKGSLLWDADGAEYIDFASGVLVLAAGHADPRIAEAIFAQANRLTNCYAHDTDVRYRAADAVLATTRGDFESVYFMSTGSESIESALKIARAVTGRPGMVSFSGAFHGKTASPVALGEAAVRDVFGSSITAPVVRALFPYPYQWDFGGDVDKTALSFLEAQIRAEGPERLGAIILEPFLGAGGVVPASPTFLRGVREIASRYGMLLILDEIQSGLGRGGEMWSYQAAGVVPDILIGAKHLGGGMPIVSLMSTREIYDQIPQGSLTSTFGGNPVSSAAAVAMLEIFETDSLVDQGKANAERVRLRLRDWERNYSIVGEGRNAGLSCGIELVRPHTRQPAPHLARKAKSLAAREGLLTMPAAGGEGNVLRFGPALNIPESQLNSGLDRLEAVISQLEAEAASVAA